MQLRLNLREISPSSPTPHSVFPSSNWNYRHLGRREKEKISLFLFYFLVYCSFFFFLWKPYKFMEKLVMTTKQTKKEFQAADHPMKMSTTSYISFRSFIFLSVETIFFSKMNKCYTKFSNGRRLEKVRFYKYVICIFSRQKLRTKTSVIPPCVFSVGGWAFF